MNPDILKFARDILKKRKAQRERFAPHTDAEILAHALLTMHRQSLPDTAQRRAYLSEAKSLCGAQAVLMVHIADLITAGAFRVDRDKGNAELVRKNRE